MSAGTAVARWLEPRKGEGEKGLRNEVTHSQGPGHIELGATDQIWGFTVGTVEIHHSSLTVARSDMAMKRSLWLPCGKIQGEGQGQEKGELKGKMMVVWTRAVMVEVVRYGLSEFRTKRRLEDIGTEDSIRNYLRIGKYLRSRIQMLGHDIMMH